MQTSRHQYAGNLHRERTGSAGQSGRIRRAAPGQPICAAVRSNAMRPRLTVLSDDLLERILDEAMRILAETGMEVRGPEMRRRLIEAGMPTNAAGDRVLFPREFVERAVRDAPVLVRAVRPGRQPVRRPRRGPRPLRARLERPARARPPHRRDSPGRHDRLRRVRPPVRRPSAHRVPGDGLLDQQGHRGTGFGRVAPLPGPDQFEDGRSCRAPSPSTACRGWPR